MSRDISLRIISWNILHDNRAKGKHRTQDERLKEIADEINKYTLESSTIVYICEAVSEEHFISLGKLLRGNIKNIGSTNYPNDWMGFFSNIDKLSFAQVKHKEMKIKWPKTASVQCQSSNFLINGVHLPDKIFSEISARLSILKTVFRSINKQKPSLIVGDFNSLFFQPARVYLRLKGYKLSKGSLFNKDQASFPARYFRGKNLPKLTPKLPIDAHYYKGFKKLKRQSYNTKLSDHPIVISDFVLK